MTSGGTSMPPAATTPDKLAAGDAAGAAKRAREEATAGDRETKKAGATVAHAEPDIRLSVGADSVTIAMHIRLAARDVKDAMEAAHRLQLGAVSDSKAQDIRVEQRSCGVAEQVHSFELTVTVSGKARAELGMLSSFDAANNMQQSETRLRLPEGADAPVWLLLDVVRLQLLGQSSQCAHPVLQSLKHIQIADFLSMPQAHLLAAKAAASAMQALTNDDADYRYKNKVWVQLCEGLARLPAVLQAHLAKHMADSCRLHPLLPPSFLDNYLSETLRCATAQLTFGDLSKSQLQTLSHHMIDLPQVTELGIGCTEALDARPCGMGSAGAALCHIFAHMPGLLTLTLRVRVTAAVRLGVSLPLPPLLRSLDLVGSVVEQYMGQNRDAVTSGVKAVLLDLSQSLKHVEKVYLPTDVHIKHLKVAHNRQWVMPPAWAGKVQLDFA